MADPVDTWVPGPVPIASAPLSSLPGEEVKGIVILPAALQQPMPPAGDAAIPRDYAQLDERTSNYRIYLDPPGPERLFRLESEAGLQERIRQEGRQQKQVDKVVFPDEPVLSKAPYYGRHWPAQQEWAESNYVCYKRLYFEQKNFERYGWDLGIITPFVSASVFYADVVTLPYHAYTDPCRCYECSAGYCLPGDPVPLLLYPVEPSLTGILAEAGSVVAVLAIFP